MLRSRILDMVAAPKVDAVELTDSDGSLTVKSLQCEFVDEAHVNESIVEMQRLLKEVVSHLQADTKADKRKAAAKLERIASLASASAQMLQAQR